MDILFAVGKASLAGLRPVEVWWISDDQTPRSVTGFVGCT